MAAEEKPKDSPRWQRRRLPEQERLQDSGFTNFPQRIFHVQVPHVTRLLSPSHTLALLVLQRHYCGKRTRTIEMSGQGLGTMLGIPASSARRLMLDMELGMSVSKARRLKLDMTDKKNAVIVKKRRVAHTNADQTAHVSLTPAYEVPHPYRVKDLKKHIKVDNDLIDKELRLAMKLTEGNAHAVLLYVVLHTIPGAGLVPTSKQFLAGKCGMSERAVRRAIVALEGAELVVRKGRSNQGDKLLPLSAASVYARGEADASQVGSETNTGGVENKHGVGSETNTSIERTTLQSDVVLDPPQRANASPAAPKSVDDTDAVYVSDGIGEADSRSKDAGLRCPAGGEAEFAKAFAEEHADVRGALGEVWYADALAKAWAREQEKTRAASPPDDTHTKHIQKETADDFAAAAPAYEEKQAAREEVEAYEPLREFRAVGDEGWGMSVQACLMLSKKLDGRASPQEIEMLSRRGYHALVATHGGEGAVGEVYAESVIRTIGRCMRKHEEQRLGFPVRFIEKALRTNITRWEQLEFSDETMRPPRDAYGSAAAIIFAECQEAYFRFGYDTLPRYLRNRGMDEWGELPPALRNGG